MSSSGTPASTEEAQPKRPSTVILLSLFTVVIAVLAATFLPDSDPAANLFRLKRLFAPAASAGRSSSSLATAATTTTTTSSSDSTSPVTNGKMGRTPVYFLSHGGVSSRFSCLVVFLVDLLLSFAFAGMCSVHICIRTCMQLCSTCGG
ncbi:uncharacterized protein BDW47DRAFT_104186 [Aspergillus candidus]|uniref:Uncharacterized protein n=1 Tax=Aspergillus candidus TaxID=41067 RepID=A0A2I2FEK0_ASPCN|nr:hypothetical protein BDW47DRAFT_104186 [Aspergillus candidus]PLB39056.1 hypothetical protein BDW47DRAFT_104186 [Aspergillus candidus]